MMLDFKRLTILHAVARHGSMRRAADELAFTASAVSQQVLALERQVGTPLLLRHSRGVRLTEAGRLLVEHTGAVLDRLERANTDLCDLVRLRSGLLRMASFPSAAAQLVPEAMGAFHWRHPDVRLGLELGVLETSVRRVRDGDLDLAVVCDTDTDPKLSTEGLAEHHLLDDVFHVGLPIGHRLARTGPIDVRELRDEVWICDNGPDPMCREMLDRVCAEAGFTPNIAFESSDYQAASGLISAGVGVALVPGLATHQMSEAVALREIAPHVVRRVSALTIPDGSPATGVMVALLADVASQ